MTDRNDAWNPEDGPPPTAEERAEARALCDALAGAPSAPKRGADLDFDSIVEVALRVRATAHPDADKTRAVASAAVEHAVTHAGQRWYRTRWRWAALAAAAVLGVGGLELALSRQPLDEGVAISRPAADVFSAPVEANARSRPIDRIADARMRAFRDGLFRAGRGAARRSR